MGLLGLVFRTPVCRPLAFVLMIKFQFIRQLVSI